MIVRDENGFEELKGDSFRDRKLEEYCSTARNDEGEFQMTVWCAKPIKILSACGVMLFS